MSHTRVENIFLNTLRLIILARGGLFALFALKMKWLWKVTLDPVQMPNFSQAESMH